MHRFTLGYGKGLGTTVRGLIVIGMLMFSLPPTSARALSAPEPVSPPEGTTATIDTHPPLAVPELSWTAVAGATSYRIQLSQDIAFASKVEFTTANTSYTPISVAALPDGTWYWRVRADAPAPAGPFSATRSFVKQWASASPELLTPAADATLEFYDYPTFTWTGVPGAATYRIQIASSPDGFASPSINQTTPATTYQPPSKLANGQYYWRVVPYDPGNRAGVPSAVRSFTAGFSGVPALLEPADSDLAHPENDPVYTPSFRWTAIRGAQLYQLQYSTDPTFAGNVTTVNTRNTSYTPSNTLSNDTNYYWRVRVQSGSSFGPWSATRRIFKRWYTQPQLLTPTNNHQAVSSPYFSWTPVPGASYYKIEVNFSNSFPPSSIYGWTAYTANPRYFKPAFRYWMNADADTVWYWRVTPFDKSNNPGESSLTYSFAYTTTLVTPQLIAPLYYYTPSVELQPHEDRTTSLPVFTWQRAHVISTTTPEVAGYRVQVDDNALFLSPEWAVDTENLNAAPTLGNPFTPVSGGLYYWRVRALDDMGSELGTWSQVWRTRIDTGQGLAATPGSVPELLRPVEGQEVTENTPLLEWWPLQGADSYEVQIAYDESFATIIDTDTVAYPIYAPTSRLEFGTYYWRVRGWSSGSLLGTWSDVGRFQIAAQSRWSLSRTVGMLPTTTPAIGEDPAGDMTNANYDLTSLYVAQSAPYWHFGFTVTTSITDVVYGLYLDLDHVEGSGATGDAMGYNITALAAHQPEYAIYLLRPTGSFNADYIAIYRWMGSGWDTPQTLSAVGGTLTATANYVEMALPNTAIGMNQNTGSAAISLFSALASGGHAQDTVPSDPNVAYTVPDSGGGSTQLSRFTSVSERLNAIWPTSNSTGDPALFPSLPPFKWQWPAGSPWYGYQFQLSRDSEFTSVVLDVTAEVNLPLHVPPSHTDVMDAWGDNTYYWRVRTIYFFNGSIDYKGAWSQANRFERQGFVPQNPDTSVTFATPTFTWDMVEGAKSYEVQVDNDPGFGSPEISQIVARNSFTPIDTLSNGTYNWRVRVRRSNGSNFGTDSSDIANDWTTPLTFTLTLPQPGGLHHVPNGIVGRAPTLCWDPVVVEEDGADVLAAWKYDIQVSRNDPTFSAIYDSTGIADTEQACWTPTKGYPDGTYYWRVAMIDGQGKQGDHSSPATFTKQYPITTLISPVNGATAGSTPTFAWTPVGGAAEYKLEVSESPTFSTLYDSVTTDNTRYTPTKKYASDKTYHWRVAMVDANGNLGPFTDAMIILSSGAFRLYLPMLIR